MTVTRQIKYSCEIDNENRDETLTAKTMAIASCRYKHSTAHNIVHVLYICLKPVFKDLYLLSKHSINLLKNKSFAF